MSTYLDRYSNVIISMIRKNNTICKSGTFYELKLKTCTAVPAWASGQGHLWGDFSGCCGLGEPLQL